MGIKTKFYPMGGGSSLDKGKLSLWRYSNDVIPDKTLLYNYMGSWIEGATSVQGYAYDVANSGGGTIMSPIAYITEFPPVTGLPLYCANGANFKTQTQMGMYDAYVKNVTNENYFWQSGTLSYMSYQFTRNASADQMISVGGEIPITLYVPKAGGKAIINDWYSTSSGGGDTDRNTPFYNNQNVVNVNLQGVPFRNNSMYYTFVYCYNLLSVKGIPNSVTNMNSTFAYCYNLNYNTQIPNSVTNMASTFNTCSNLNQNIQIPNSVTNMAYTFYGCYNLNQNIQIPNSVTNMYDTFGYCYNLNQNIKIPNSVISMVYTFLRCYNLNQNIKIPNPVTGMYGTFQNCFNLNQNIQIGNSVMNMYNTFYGCYNLNQNIQIPNSVTDMSGTFSYCSNLNQNIQIPNSVTNMNFTFQNCYNLNQSIQIPNSVTSMPYTFQSCRNLNQNIQIGKSVTNMYSTFNYCNNMSSWINILSANITNASYTFNVNNASCIPNVLFPVRYINNISTATTNTIKSAGWVTDGTGTILGTSPNRIVGWDHVKGDFNTYVGNGTHWVLSKWNGRLTTALNGGTVVTDITTPVNITSYDTFPTAIVASTCYKSNTVINSVNILEGSEWVGNTTVNAFEACTNLKGVNFVNGKLNSFVTNTASMFRNSKQMAFVRSSTPFNMFESVTAAPHMFFNTGITSESFINTANGQPVDLVNDYPLFPNTVDMEGTFEQSLISAIPNISPKTEILHFGSCNNLVDQTIPKGAFKYATGVTQSYSLAQKTTVVNINDIPPRASNLAHMAITCPSLTTIGCHIPRSTRDLTTFANPANNLTGDIYIDGAHVSAANRIFSNNQTKRRNVYIYFTRRDGVATQTKNTFVGALWYYANGKANAKAKNILTNRRNTYVYNRGISPYFVGSEATATTNGSNVFISNYSNSSACPDVVLATLENEILETNMFKGDTILNSVDLYYTPYTSTPNSPVGLHNMSNAFAGCTNLKRVTNMNDLTTNLSNTYNGCTSLQYTTRIPVYAEDMSNMYNGCTNFVGILNSYGNGIEPADMTYEMEPELKIYPSVRYINDAFKGCSNLTGKINITSTEIDNSVNTFYQTTKAKSVYIYFNYANGIPTKTYNSVKSRWDGQNGVTVYNLGRAPW